MVVIQDRGNIPACAREDWSDMTLQQAIFLARPRWDAPSSPRRRALERKHQTKISVMFAERGNELKRGSGIHAQRAIHSRRHSRHG